MLKFTARCPGCFGKFPWDPKLGYPERCPLPGCDYVSPERDEVVIAAPFIRSPSTNKTDACYRQLERDSEVRMQLAADKYGIPASELSSIKITNIKDNVQPGESAAMPVVNEVTRHMDALQRTGRAGPMGFVANAGQEFAPAAAQGVVTVNGQVSRGIEPRAGVRAMDGTQKLLSQIVGPHRSRMG